MVQAQFSGRTDVHGGTLANRFHTAEHFDRVGVITTLALAFGVARSKFAIPAGRIGIALAVLLRFGSSRPIHNFFGSQSNSDLALPAHVSWAEQSS